MSNPTQRELVSTIRMPSRQSDFGVPAALLDCEDFLWDDSQSPARNYAALGNRLAKCADVFRHSAYGSGVIVVPSCGSEPPIAVTTGPQLGAVLVDRVPVKVARGDKVVDASVPSHHLKQMLLADTLLAS